MAEAFARRQELLEQRIRALRNPDSDSGERQCHEECADIAELQSLLCEAEACYEIYEQFDDGYVLPDDHPEMKAQLDERREAGLPLDPKPSWMKYRAWMHLRIARGVLASAYGDSGAHGEALPLHRLMIEHSLRMRHEVWGNNNAFHVDVLNLANCLFHCGNFDEARQWYERGLHFCEREDPGSETHQHFKRSLAVMSGHKAGPVQGGSGRRKSWKMCWTCSFVERPGASKQILRCRKCYDLKVATPAYYCSKKCQQEDWERHKFFHQSLEKKLLAAEDSHEDKGLLLEHPRDEYIQLIVDVEHALNVEGNQVRARRLLEKAIKMYPGEPLAHDVLAHLFCICHNFEGMMKESCEVMRICEKGQYDSEFLWSSAAMRIYWTSKEFGAEFALLDKPKWLTNPRKLEQTAKRVCQHEPDDFRVWIMRADASEALGKLDEACNFLGMGQKVAYPEENKKQFGLEIQRLRRLLQQKQEDK